MTSLFHPFELAVCGPSGSGKTTLITRLLAHLAPTHRVGYAKHSSHAFAIDTPGKDSARARDAGATRVFLTNDHATAMTTAEPMDIVQRRTAFDDCDCVLAEGWKSSPLPRIAMLGAGDGVPDEPTREKSGPVLAWVGVEPARPRAGAGPGATGAGAPRLQGFEEAPYFQRDDIAGLGAFVTSHFLALAARIPLYGLVLAGGRSTRMQRDKAALEYAGKPQLLRTFELATTRCAQTFISARAGQWTDGRFADLPQIVDTVQDCGPTGGILSAMRAHPTAAWLVLACDLPHLDAGTLDLLIRGRHPLKIATAFRSSSDSLPEPLCAIYEPPAQSRLFQFLAIGYHCPRKMLINSNVRLLELANRRALENVNRPEEYAQAARELAARGS